MIDDIPREVRESIYDHVFASDDIEVGGVLVGAVDESGTAQVHGMIAALEAEGSRASVTFTHSAWEQIIEIQERDFPDSPTIVGWYHSHPGFGVFLSEHDMFIHENFFSEPFHVAYVVDPQEETEGMFGWQDGRVVAIGEEGMTPRRRGRRRVTLVVDVADASLDATDLPPDEEPARASSPRMVIADDDEEPKRRRRGIVPLLVGVALMACVAVVLGLNLSSSDESVSSSTPRTNDTSDNESDASRTASLMRDGKAQAAVIRQRESKAQEDFEEEQAEKRRSNGSGGGSGRRSGVGPPARPHPRP